MSVLGRLTVAALRTTLLVVAIIAIVEYADSTPKQSRRLSGIAVSVMLLFARDGIHWEGKL